MIIQLSVFQNIPEEKQFTMQGGKAFSSMFIKKDDEKIFLGAHPYLEAPPGQIRKFNQKTLSALRCWFVSVSAGQATSSPLAIRKTPILHALRQGLILASVKPYNL